MPRQQNFFKYLSTHYVHSVPRVVGAWNATQNPGWVQEDMSVNRLGPRFMYMDNVALTLSELGENVSEENLYPV